MTTATRDLLERLKLLQALDLEIAEAERELSAGPAAAAELSGELAELDPRIRALEDKNRIFKAQIKLRENELKGLEQKIKRLKDQSSLVKTNKEFMAFRSEISGFQAEADRMQGEILKILDAVEKGDAGIRELHEQRARVERRRDEAQAKVESRLGGVRARRDELKARRPGLLEGIPAEPLETYERALRMRGNPLATVEGDYCGGCMERLTKNDVIAVQNSSRLVTCKACNRVLVTS